MTQTEHNTTVKNPSCLETNQLAIYKCSLHKFRTYCKGVLNPGSLDLKASALTTGPQYLKLLSGELGAVQVTIIFVKHLLSRLLVHRILSLTKSPKKSATLFRRMNSSGNRSFKSSRLKLWKIFPLMLLAVQFKCDNQMRLTARKHSKNMYLKHVGITSPLVGLIQSIVFGVELILPNLSLGSFHYVFFYWTCQILYPACFQIVIMNYT